MTTIWPACAATSSSWPSASISRKRPKKIFPASKSCSDEYSYCGHMKYEMGGMLLAPGATAEKIKKLIEKTKKIADEKGYKGGQHRLHYIAVGRSIK